MRFSAALVALVATLVLPASAAPPHQKRACNVGFFLSGGDCKPCLNPLAETCNKHGQTLACKAPLFRSGNACVERCHTLYYGSTDRICMLCPPFSASCTAAGPTSCQNGYDLDGKACLKSCTAGKYRSDGTCVDCPDPKAATCNNSGATLTCKDGLVKSADGCMESCGEGFFANSARICTACTGEGVKACTATGPTSCNSGFKLSSDKKKCIRGCEDGFWLSGTNCKACGPNAERCDIYGRALACKAPFVRSGSYCATACHPLYYANADRVCFLCPPNSSACTADGPTRCQPGYALSEDKKRCVKTCPAGQRLSGSSCIDCGPGVATCDANGVALTCKPGLVKAGTACQENCNEGSYPSQDSVCTACAGENVKTCTSSGPTACNSGFFLSSDSKECVSSCGSAEYASDRVCKSCPANASSCDSNGAVITCQSGFVKYGSSCSSACPEGSFPDSNSDCASCPVNAESCTSMEVTACNSGYSISSDSKSCVKVCDAGFWLSGSDCVACGAGAKTCDSNGVTLTCEAGKVRAGTSCLDSCPDGSYANQDSVCSPCGENVKTCTAADVVTCMPGFLISRDVKSCVATCGPAEWVISGAMCTPCRAGAATCDNSGRTLTCREGLFRKNLLCVESCGGGYYPDDGVCKPCPGENVSTCSSDGLAISSCISPFLVDNNQCVQSCSAGKYSPDGRMCSPCPGLAATCTAEGQALTCPSGRFLSNGECVGECPTSTVATDGVCQACPSRQLTCPLGGTPTCTVGSVYDVDSKTCLEQCSDIAYRFGSSCYKNNCPDGSFLWTSTNPARPARDHPLQCYACTGQNVKTCSQTKALTCTSSDYSPGTRFNTQASCYYNKCEAAWYPVDTSTTCAPCPAGVASCTPVDAFIERCVAGLYFNSATYPTSCTATCPAGYRMYKAPSLPFIDHCARCPNFNEGVLTCDAAGNHLTCADGWKIKYSFTSRDVCVPV